MILHGNPSALARDFSPHMAVLRRHFLPNVHFQCCVLLLVTLGGDFDIFAASGESTAWVLLWKTRSRPIGVWVCPAAQFNFFSTAFDPREWTMVVFWKEDSGRQPQLITPENRGGDETGSPSPPRFTFFVPLGPSPPPWTARSAWTSTRMAPSSTCWWEREKERAENASHERSRPRSPSQEPQLNSIPIIDNDDDQPPQATVQIA